MFGTVHRDKSVSPGWRKLLLTVHVVVSVGLIGADMFLIVLGITGLTSGIPEVIQASYLTMELLVETILLPFAIAALFSGILLGLSTSWGLVRYYWVLTKLALTLTVLTALVFLLRPMVTQAAVDVLEIPLSDLTTTGIGQIGITIRPAIALLILLIITILAIYKPWGQIRA